MGFDLFKVIFGIEKIIKVWLISLRHSQILDYCLRVVKCVYSYIAEYYMYGVENNEITHLISLYSEVYSPETNQTDSPLCGVTITQRNIHLRQIFKSALLSY